MIVKTTENIAGYELEVPKVVSIVEKLKMNPVSYEVMEEVNHVLAIKNSANPAGKDR